MDKRMMIIQLEDNLRDINHSINYLQTQLGPGWQMQKLSTGQFVGMDMIAAKSQTLMALAVLRAYPDVDEDHPELEEPQPKPGEYVPCKRGGQKVCTHEMCGYIPWSEAYKKDD